jgi:hypothetical protein
VANIYYQIIKAMGLAYLDKQPEQLSPINLEKQQQSSQDQEIIIPHHSSEFMGIANIIKP